MLNTDSLFSIANVFILLNWLPLLLAPQSKLTQKLIQFPFIPLVLSVFYLFFLPGQYFFSYLNMRLYHASLKMTGMFIVPHANYKAY